jgi:hypothetical protein
MNYRSQLTICPPRLFKIEDPLTEERFYIYALGIEDARARYRDCKINGGSAVKVRMMAPPYGEVAP